MQKHNFANRTDSGYKLGLRFLDFGETVRRDRELYQKSKERLTELSRETKERMWCIVRDGTQGVYLYGVGGDRSVQTYARNGRYSKLHHLAGGKAILAHLPDELVERVILEEGLPAMTKNTIIDADKLYPELERIREEGVAYNLEESVIGIHAVGAPIKDKQEEAVGAISISGPAKRLTETRLKGELREMILGSANEIEINLQYS